MAGALRSRAWRSFRWTRQSVTVLVCQSVSWSVFSDRRVSTQSKGQEKERLSWSLREIDQQVQQRQQHMHRLLHNVGTVHSGKLQSDNDGDTQVSPLPLPAPLPLPSAPSNYRRTQMQIVDEWVGCCLAGVRVALGRGRCQPKQTDGSRVIAHL